MKKELLESALSSVEDRWIGEAVNYTHPSKRKLYIRFAAAAACFAVAAGAAGIILYRRNHQPIPETPFTPQLQLTDRTTAKIRRADETGEAAIAAIASKSELVWLTEEELFSDPRMIAFRGTVIKLQNYEITFDSYKQYRCIAYVRAEKDYRGDIRPGEIVSILLPCPIDPEGQLQEDTETIRNISVGCEGIFLPYLYTDASCWSEGESVVMLRELAMCGLGDGMRHVFLQSGQKIIYEQNAYQSAGRLRTLEDAEAYVTDMLKRFPMK